MGTCQCKEHNEPAEKNMSFISEAECVEQDKKRFNFDIPCNSKQISTLKFKNFFKN